MGYVLAAITFDPSEVRSALGSGDAGLIARVIRKYADDFDDDEYPDDYTGVTLRNALAELVNHGDGNELSHHEYAYAFEALVKAIGRVHFADRYDLDEIEGRRLFDQSLPYRIPNAGEFPRLAVIKQHSIDDELAYVLTLADEPELELKPLWLSCLRFAKRKNKDILVTYG